MTLLPDQQDTRRVASLFDFEMRYQANNGNVSEAVRAGRGCISAGRSLGDEPILISALIRIAQTYLGAEPIADVMGLWWHTAFSDKPDSEAAQFFHFDMDRIKWIKFFICLTDVAPENGPHFFIEGSHRTKDIPNDLLSRGYVRLTDEEVARHYPAKDFVEFTAPRGTIIAEDTRGLHKGQHVRCGHRLMLQIQFSNCLFGPPYPRISFSRIVDPALADAVRCHPRIFSAFLPTQA